METDAALFEVFEANPSRFGELTNRLLPVFRSAISPALKKSVQVTCDLYFEPVDPNQPHWIGELQFYFDHSIFNRIDLARSMIWKKLNSRKNCLKVKYEPVEVRGIVIFGTRKLLPPQTDRHSTIEYLFLDELVASLKKRDPSSPLLPVLAPLVDTKRQLEKHAAKYYDSLKGNPNIDEDERNILSDVFIQFLSQRFKNLTIQDILKMIAELTPIEETQVGKELIDRGIEQGIEQGEEKIIIKQAKARFPKLTKKHQDQIRALPSDKLEELAIALLDFESLGDLGKWLKKS